MLAPINGIDSVKLKVNLTGPFARATSYVVAVASFILYEQMEKSNVALKKSDLNLKIFINIFSCSLFCFEAI